MEALIHETAHQVALVIEAIAILVVAAGTLQAVIGVFRVGFSSHAGNVARRAVWMDYARWLVAGLTFQLAADIVSTTFAGTWQDIARLGLIAVIRTFLSYFLDKEVADTRHLLDTKPAPDSTPDA